MLVGYRTGDMWAPQLDVTEALAVEAAHFDRLHRRNDKTPIADGQAGLRVVRLLEAATESMRAARPRRRARRQQSAPHDSVSSI